MNEIKVITDTAFAPYGTVLKFPDNPPDPRFHVVITEDSAPWRLAVYRVKERDCDKLECHVSSLESFEPMQGTGLIVVACHDTPEKHEIFLLNQPVCLHKGTWHQMITLSSETIVKIAENLDVSSEFYDMSRPIRAILER